MGGPPLRSLRAVYYALDSGSGQIIHFVVLNNAHIYGCTVRIRNVRFVCVFCQQTAVHFTIFIDFALFYGPAGDKLHTPYPTFLHSSSSSSLVVPLVWLIVTAHTQLMPPNKFRALFQVSRLRPFSRGETIYQSRRCLWQP